MEDIIQWRRRYVSENERLRCGKRRKKSVDSVFLVAFNAFAKRDGVRFDSFTTGKPRTRLNLAKKQQISICKHAATHSSCCFREKGKKL